MLYRLDRNTQAGMVPVTDLLGPVLLRNYRSARELARREAAKDLDGCVRCTRIGNSGHLSAAFDAYPDGRIVRCR